MTYLSSYAYLGLPDSLAMALTLVSLSLALTPWLAGTDYGIFKVPNLPTSIARPMKYIAPTCFAIFIAGFLKIIPVDTKPHSTAVDVRTPALEILSAAHIQALNRDYRTRLWEGEDFSAVLGSISELRLTVQKKYVEIKNSANIVQIDALRNVQQSLIDLENTLRELQPHIGDIAALSVPPGSELLVRAEHLRSRVNASIQTFAEKVNLSAELPPPPT
ncbi:hypothetical protein M5J07_20785 [Achromobacter mucicolens]|uniref:hypothetical protein n=1 Tax=Achromobacter mucicolens TaxID=1389922 RepID=UPI0020A527B0|nr:hypothetical protein [Achromobacter mucicolens]MCP2517388.1 hypothetical protein [Achromobacter mucicolens]